MIKAGKIPETIMATLRGLMQMSPKLGFAFAGLHTLEEMTEDYFHPFFASPIPPIKVSFLTPGAVRQIIANPHDDSPLDYDPQAIDIIYAQTSGQPYLCQLIGWLLVRRYNTQVFEQGRKQDPIFTPSDVNAIVTDPDLFNRGRYYFTGVWNQADPHQHQIIKALAPDPEGLSLSTLAQRTTLNPTDLENALITLKRHDVIQQHPEDLYQIRVELFRTWITRFHDD